MGKIQTLSIDIESYSDADLQKCGVYKYAQSSNFEILLFGVSVNGGEVIVYDLAQGEELPMDIITALADDTVTKWAFNAAFERVCLSETIRSAFAVTVSMRIPWEIILTRRHGNALVFGRHIWDCRFPLPGPAQCLGWKNRS